MQKPRHVLISAGLLVIGLAAQAWASTPKMDFNNDGYTDLAIAAPEASVNGKVMAGTVTVIYGTSAGLTSSTGAQLWHRDLRELSSIPGGATAYGFFGSALAAGDFNRDGYTDLAIGAPFHYELGLAGTVIILYGTSVGLRGYRNPCSNPCFNPQVFSMASPQGGDRFGSALAVGDFDGDNRHDLAVGAPYYDVNGVINSGAVRIFKGTSTGLTETGSLVLSLVTTGMIGIEAEYDQFGYSLAAGNFGKDGAKDLAIGIPGKEFTSVEEGAVSVVYGGQNGLSPNAYTATGGYPGGGNQMWTAHNTFPSSMDWDDGFGTSLAAGNFGNGSYDDLAIGFPWRTVTVPLDGAVIVLYGSASGLSLTGSQIWSLGSAGVVGQPVQFDSFGRSLVAGDFGWDAYEDLAIGVPGHPVQGLDDVGVVSILVGSSSGLKGMSNPLLQPYAATAGEAFGSSLSAARFGGNSYFDLAIGVPGWNGTGGLSIRYSIWEGTGPSSTTDDAFWPPTPLSVTGVDWSSAGFGRRLSN